MLLKKYLRMREHIRNQWLSSDRLAEIQNAKLKKLISHAYNNVPYYQNLFRSVGLDPTDIQSAEDLKKIPIISKEERRHLPISELIANDTNLKTCIHGKTSGSTGIPHQVILSPRDLLRHNALWHSLLNVCGRKATDKILSITSRFPKVYKKRWYEYVGLGRTEFLFITEEPDALVQKVLRINPDIILSYPTTLLVLAEAVKRKRMDRIRPRVIISTSETLDMPARRYINEAFNTEVIDYYGSWESGMIAWECQRHEGYHINVDSVIVEVIRNNQNAGSGEMGEIVVTNLNAFTMPFIRFNLKDIGTNSEKLCSCGRELPMLEKVEGRSDEIIMLPDGELLAPIVFYALKYIDGVEKFQIVQETIDRLEVCLVVNKLKASEIVEKVEEVLKKTIREKIKLNVHVINDIPVHPSGKQRCVISKCKPQFN